MPELVRANHGKGRAIKIERWDRFSAGNVSQSEGKLTYVIILRQ
jgi:hypothetical protein